MDSAKFAKEIIQGAKPGQAVSLGNRSFIKTAENYCDIQTGEFCTTDQIIALSGTGNGISWYCDVDTLIEGRLSKNPQALKGLVVTALNCLEEYLCGIDPDDEEIFERLSTNIREFFELYTEYKSLEADND